MSEQKSKDALRDLAVFVDDNFKPSTIQDIFNAFPQSLFVLAFVFLACVVGLSSLSIVPLVQWSPTLVSVTAILIAFYSFIMVSRKYANKRIAYRESKRIESLLKEKNKETLCLLPCLVALKMENNPIKLQDLYDVNKEMFVFDKLMENYYFN